MNNKLQKLAAKALTDVLGTKLHVEANTVSSIFIHQPKVPENLSRFKEKK
ncbi:MAG: cyclic lactone autoinducer peptide [Lachnospiraceae bacterium]|nr:cyclic lactone autoinducer peptide [Lachnospiraceae bacterium]